MQLVELQQFTPEKFGAMSRPERRAAILRLQDELAKMPSNADQCDVAHHFAPGMYAREFFMPAGSLVIGKIHRHSHVNVISHGRCTVFTEAGREELAAPVTWVNEPGTKRVVLAHTDVFWTTIHATGETDLKKIEQEVISAAFEDLPTLVLEAAP